MHQITETTYWIAIAHLPNWKVARINELVVKVIHEGKLCWDEFFELSPQSWMSKYGLTEKEAFAIQQAKDDIPRLAFIAEQLQSEGFHVIPLNSPDYPPILKANLKKTASPTVVYVKGRLRLLKAEAIAIVGSRKAGKSALDFTDTIAKKMVHQGKVVVSGFAKGVDKQALESALEAGGKSIIVLPQGILTFQSGLKKYYSPIVNGDVLVLSTFFPKAGWSVGLAMARNVYIYGLAKEIYVAESDSKGGTWEGVKQGLKRNCKIFVRVPEPNEKNANQQLIDLGAIPVSEIGAPLEKSTKKVESTTVNEAMESYETTVDEIEKQVLALLQKGEFSAKEILLILKLDWDSRKLSDYLKNNPNVKVVVGKPLKFTRNETFTPSLFG
ncbi:MAG: DNA-processing protein DprA [Cyclobacteriaceae bacterium]